MRNRVAFALACLCALAAPLRAEAAGAIRGTVEELETGRRIRGAQVFVTEFNLQAETDSVGGFIIRGILPGQRIMRAAAAFREPWSGNVSVADGETSHVEVKLRRTPNPGSVAGTVTGDDGKKRVPHAAVLLGTPPSEGRADEEGFFSTSGLDPGLYKMKAGGLGYVPVDFEVFILEGRTTLFTVDLGRSLLEGGPRKKQSPKSGKPGAPPDSLTNFKFLVRDRLPSAPAGPSRRVPVVLDVMKEDAGAVCRLGEWSLYPGPYVAPWDGRDSTRRAAPSGRYKLHICMDGEWSDGEELKTR